MLKDRKREKNSRQKEKLKELELRQKEKLLRLLEKNYSIHLKLEKRELVRLQI